LRLKPEEYVRWYEPYAITFGQELPKREPDWGKAKNCILQKGSVEDKKWANNAQLRWDFLNMGAHPSGIGIDQVRSNITDKMKFYPEYEPFYCIQTLGHGVFVQSALLREIVELSDRPDGFRQDYATFMTDAAALADFVRPSLEPLSRAIAAERKERTKRRNSQRRIAHSQSSSQE
jgi:hypothetical protein